MVMPVMFEMGRLQTGNFTCGEGLGLHADSGVHLIT